MTEILEGVAKWLVSQGPIGIAAMLLGWRLWQRETELSAIQKERLADNRENIKALTDANSTLKWVAEAMGKSTESTRDLAETIRSLEAEINRVRR